jgi:hypothetical protein
VVLDVDRDQGPLRRLLQQHSEPGVTDPGSRLVDDSPGTLERLAKALPRAPVRM